MNKKDTFATRSQQGGTFVLVMLAILVFTFLGLSLAVVTDTEMELGANLRSINRTYFGAESGLAVAIAGVVTTNKWCLEEGDGFLLAERQVGDPSAPNNLVLGYRVRADSVRLISQSFAPLSNANVGSRRQYTYFVRTTATAQRVAYREDDATEDVVDFENLLAGLHVDAQRVATTSMLLSPAQQPPLDQFECDRAAVASDG